MTTLVGNRGQLWTSTLSPHLLRPYFNFRDLSLRKSQLFPKLQSQKNFARLGALGYRPKPHPRRHSLGGMAQPWWDSPQELGVGCKLQAIIGGSVAGVWNDWGVWKCNLSGSEFQISEPEVW